MNFLLDTDTASRLMRADRATVTSMRRSGATDISISVVTQAELLYGARLRSDKPALLAAVRDFLERIAVRTWDAEAAEHLAEIRAVARSIGRSAGAYDLMIVSHARALGATLVTSDKAIGNLEIAGVALVDWSGKKQ